MRCATDIPRHHFCFVEVLNSTSSGFPTKHDVFKYWFAETIDTIVVLGSQMSKSHCFIKHLHHIFCDSLQINSVFEGHLWPLTASGAAESLRRVRGESGERPRGVLGQGPNVSLVVFLLLWKFLGVQKTCLKPSFWHDLAPDSAQPGRAQGCHFRVYSVCLFSLICRSP